MEVGQEHIDKYLRNEMSPDELKEFLVELERNPSLADSVAVQRQIVDAIRAEGHANLKQWLAAETEGVQVKQMYGRFWLFTAVAATVVLAVFAYYFMIPTQKTGTIVRNESPVLDNKAETEKPNSDFPNKKPSDTIPPPPSVLTIIKDDELVEIQDVETDEIENGNFPTAEDVIPPPRVEEVRRDEKIGNIQATVVVLTDMAEKSGLAEETVSREFKRISSKEKSTAPESELDKDVEIEVEKIHIELWNSTVRYQGYKFWNHKLILYGPAKEDSISVLRLGNNYYLHWSDGYYLLKEQNDFQFYIKLKEQELPNSLKH